MKHMSHINDFNEIFESRWRHEMETFSALLADSPVPGEFPTQRPVTRSFDVFYDLRLNKRLSKQSWGWWFEMPSRPLWRHLNVTDYQLNRSHTSFWFDSILQFFIHKSLECAFLSLISFVKANIWNAKLVVETLVYYLHTKGFDNSITSIHFRALVSSTGKLSFSTFS